MGRIKTKLIKSLTFQLMEVYGDKFTTDFDKNKEILHGKTDMNSKKMRNTVAGYLTRLKKAQN
ncbi:MAG: 30S ribosomal protein S17e [Nanoarchaeota archaeon]|nr:30S ribosomal protein S17e [Nanoarchaeota archaeon]